MADILNEVPCTSRALWVGATPLTRVSATDACAAIAAAVRPHPAEDIPHTLGAITLQPGQRAGASRVLQTIARWGGALLCDPVGTGKTYLALAIAHRHGDATVIAPAAIRHMWRGAARRAEVVVRIVSTEGVSRGREIPRGALLIVDEAHHVRTPSTRRHRAVASVARTTPTLLVTATPVHNRRADLVALLSLFLGPRASALTDDEIAALVIRRTDAAEATGSSNLLPRVLPTRWHRQHDDATILAQLRALPPPVPPADGDPAAALVVHALARQWASSDAALAGAIRRRLARSAALSDALRSGRYPSRDELRAWKCSEDDVQLAFPALVAPSSDVTDRAALLAAVEQHGEALRVLARDLAARPGADAARAERLRTLRRDHPDARIVAFTCFADTARAMYRAVRSAGHVGLLTSAGGEVAGGRLPRHALLARFAPHATGVAPPRSCDDVTLLIATDLASEGVNLQDASIVVHLDLPWTNARLVQRVGRAARLGSTHEHVTVVGFRPGFEAERFLRMERALRRKLRAASTVTAEGEDPASPPRSTPRPARARAATSSIATAERVRGILTRWVAAHDPALVSGRPDASVWAALPASRNAALACFHLDGECQLVAWTRGAPATARWSEIGRLAHLVDDARDTPDHIDNSTATPMLRHALAAFTRWAERETARRAVGIPERLPRNSAARQSRSHDRDAITHGPMPARGSLWGRPPAQTCSQAEPTLPPVAAPRLVALIVLVDHAGGEAGRRVPPRTARAVTAPSAPSPASRSPTAPAADARPTSAT